MHKEFFQGTGRLLRLLFRENRFKIIAWILGIVLVSLTVAIIYPEIYTSQEDIRGFALTMENPAMSALIGSNYHLDDFNLGVIYASEMLLFTSIAVAIMNILLMKSSSRGDEEDGRLEIIQSLPVGKISYLTASFLMLFIVNALIVVALSMSLFFFGIDVYTWESSLLYSSILGITGLFFAGVTGVSAQLGSTAYATNILSMGALLVSYVIRMIGDVQFETLSLFSPLGWTTRTDVFVTNNWLPILVLASGSLILIFIAFYLHAQRDILAGILPNRPGERHASGFLKTMPGFIWHLEKTKVIAWFLLFFFLSVAFGSILGELESYFSDMDLIEQVIANRLGADMVEQFTSFMIAIMSAFSLFPVISILHGMKSEETKGHLEHLYTRSVSRNKVFFAYLAFALISAVLMQFATALGIFLSASEVLNHSISLRTMIEMTMIYIPAIYTVMGISVLLIGALPKVTSLSWAYVVFILLILYLGNMLDLPAWLVNLSAYHQVPEYPYETVKWHILGILTGIGLTLTIVGSVGYNQRDM